MVNEEIMGGLRAALERGESIKKAMITLYNSGYSQSEIEEAAKSLASSGFQPAVIQPQPSQSQTVQTQQSSVQSQPVQIKPSVSPQVQQPAKQSEPFADIQFQSPVQTQQIQQPVLTKQKVSSYGNDSTDKALIFILVGILIFLFGVLISIFIFKDELINFFSSFFA